MTTRAEVEKAIDASHPLNGLIVMASGGKLLATREPLEGGRCTVVVMPPEAPQAATRPEAPAARGNLPATDQTPVQSD